MTRGLDMRFFDKFKTVNVFLLTLVGLSVGLGSCTRVNYGFSGTSLSPDIKSISVVNFTMGTAGGPPNLSLKFNEKIKEYYQRNTNLILLPNNGDLQLEGSITGYETTPVAPTSSDQAALTRLTITVQVKYSNAKTEDKDFDKNFSFYKDFPQSQTLNQVENKLIEDIFTQIIQDIFTATAADW
jgi:Lipopolysaccharide-assembly